jgi:UDP-N-acetyl-D-mannosaminuronic acid dehydrogenase
MSARKKVAVVGGCGHVGLPLSIALAPFHEVIIYDIDVEAVARVRKGEIPFLDEGAEEGLAAALRSGLQVYSTPERLAECDYVILVIGTPVDRHLNPSVDLLDRLLDELSAILHAGQVLVLRSTVYPGTTERARQYFQRRGVEIEVVFCPERVAQGFALREIKTLPQIIAGFTPFGLSAARALFAPLQVELIELTPLEAELTKLFNNVYRYVTFAIANQFYMLATEYDLDFYRILHAMKHHYPRGAQMPGPGFAAGPCLFKDTMQLSAFNNNQFFMGHAAMLVNEGLPQFVVNRMDRRWPDLHQRTVGILGMAFKSDSDDARESLSYKLKKLLEIRAGCVLTSDPFVADTALLPEHEVLSRADLLILGAPHSRYRGLDFGDTPVIDIWNLTGQGGAI